MLGSRESCNIGRYLRSSSVIDAYTLRLFLHHRPFTAEMANSLGLSPPFRNILTDSALAFVGLSPPLASISLETDDCYLTARASHSCSLRSPTGTPDTNSRH